MATGASANARVRGVNRRNPQVSVVTYPSDTKDIRDSETKAIEDNHPNANSFAIGTMTLATKMIAAMGYEP